MSHFGWGEGSSHKLKKTNLLTVFFLLLLKPFDKTVIRMAE
jgi:hypothetical protein